MYTAEQLAELTEEERLAIQEDDELEETGDEDALDPINADGTDGAEGDDEDDKGEGGTDDTDSDDDTDNNADSDDDTGDTANAGDQEESEEDDVEVNPILKADMPDGYEETIAGFNTEREELAALFDDGELTATEFFTKHNDIAKRESIVEQGAFKAQIAQDMETQRAQNEWSSTVDKFLRANTQFNPKDYPMRYKALDDAVRSVATANQSWSGNKVLEEASKQVSREFGFTENPKKPGKKPIDVPPTLHGVPSSEMEDAAGGGKYANLDRLLERDPEAYEAALGKMSDAERETYLASA